MNGLAECQGLRGNAAPQLGIRASTVIPHHSVPSRPAKTTPILFRPTKLIGPPNKLAYTETSGAESRQGSNLNINNGDKILEGPGALNDKQHVTESPGEEEDVVTGTPCWSKQLGLTVGVN